MVERGARTRTDNTHARAETLYEDSETFDVVLGSPTGASLGLPAAATVSIANDELAPWASVAPTVTSEGNSALFEVTLSPVSGRPATVGYVTASGSALAGGDYPTTVGTVTIPTGATKATVAIGTFEDTIVETQ